MKPTGKQVKLAPEWLNKLTVRFADVEKTLQQAQPYTGDKKLILAHDLYLIARDYRQHIAALEAELLAAHDAEIRKINWCSRHGVNFKREDACAPCMAEIKERVRRETLEEAAKERDRHAQFCKNEAENGGDWEHLVTRKEEAIYNAKRIRSLASQPVSTKDQK